MCKCVYMCGSTYVLVCVPHESKRLCMFLCVSALANVYACVSVYICAADCPHVRVGILAFRPTTLFRHAPRRHRFDNPLACTRTKSVLPELPIHPNTSAPNGCNARLTFPILSVAVMIAREAIPSQ